MRIKKRVPRVMDRRRFSPIEGNYWCQRCNELVPAEEYYDTDTGYREVRCSCCLNDGVDEADKCNLCGDYMSPYGDTGVSGLCKCCVEELDDCINSATEAYRQKKGIGYIRAKNLIWERLDGEDEI